MFWQEVLKLNSLLLSSLAIERAGPGARLFQFKKSKWIGNQPPYQDTSITSIQVYEYLLKDFHEESFVLLPEF